MRLRRPNSNYIAAAGRAALIFAALAQLLVAAEVPALHIRNFGAVNDRLYRGGAPTPEGLKELASAHVLMIVDLREYGTATGNEQRVAESLGMKYVNVPLPALSAPTQDAVKRVLSLITPDDSGRVFVHCRRGKDRTGTVIACYRIQHDGWDNGRAAREASSYGMSRTERGMRAFILAFHPVDLPAPLSAAR